MSESIKLLNNLSLLEYALAERSFVHFFKSAWPVLEPSTPLLFNWHHQLIAEYLQAVFNGDVKRLIINVPPRYSKSLLVTVMFPAWCWIKDPKLRFINASYSADLATKHGVDRRVLMKSDWYQNAWSDRFTFSREQDQKTEYVNNHRGHMVSTGMLGSITGKGGDILVIDDPHNPKKAESVAERTSAIEAFDSTFTTRLDNKKTGRIIIVMQRLHHRDLTGHLLEKTDENWVHIKLPVEAPKRTTIEFPLSRTKKTREEGEILHPEREGPKEIQAMRTALGSYNFAGQYEQNPSPRSGGIFKKHYWRYFTRVPERFDELIQSWDMTFKDPATADYVAGLVLGRVGAEIYILDAEHAQMGFGKTKEAILRLTKRWPTATKKLIENKANGPAIENDLRSLIPGMVLEEPQGSKMERAAFVEPYFEAGNVLVPHPSIAQPWVQKLLDEASTFPKSTHDDLVDAMTQGVRHLMKRTFDKLKALGTL